jgi:ATP-binding cassette subfamily F protein 3
MEMIAPAHVDTPFHFAFRDPPKIPHPLLALEHASAGYTEQPVFSDANLKLVPGDRVGLLGPNGAGKSTLIKVLAKTQAVMSGERIEPQDVRIGYFAQHQLEQLDVASSPLQHLQDLDRRAKEQDLRNFLGGFGFSGDAVTGSVALFSGGEKARLVLSMLVYQRPNVLLLDEPTNHLDLEMRHALTLALQDFGGAMVIVSHDRFLLRSVTDRWLMVADGTVQEYDGDLEEYRAWLSDRRARQQQAPALAGKPDSAQSRKDRKRSEAEVRQRQQPLRKKVQELEKRLESLTKRCAEIDAQLAGDVYGSANKEKLKDLLRDQARFKVELGEVEDLWLEASESLHQAVTQDGG